MATDTRSTHKNLPVPDTANDVNEDMARVGVAIEAIGTLIHLVEQDLASKAADDHDHVIGDVQGLQAALDALDTAVSGLSTPGLNDLGDVDVSSASNGMVLLYLAGAWQAAKIAAGNVTYGGSGNVAGQLDAIDVSLSSLSNSIVSLTNTLGQKANSADLGALAAKNQVGTGDLIASEVMAALGLGYETRVSGGKAQYKDGSNWKNFDAEALAKATANEAAIAGISLPTIAELEVTGFSNGVWYTVPHGLGERPNIVQLFAECVVATGGYSVGDRVMLGNVDSSNNDGSAVNLGCGLSADATSVRMATGNSGSLIVHRTANHKIAVSSSFFKLVAVAVLI